MTAGQGTAEVHGTNCDYDVGGCEAIAPPGTIGDSLNQGGGGIWATQIEAEGIKIWHSRGLPSPPTSPATPRTQANGVSLS